MTPLTALATFVLATVRLVHATFADLARRLRAGTGRVRTALDAGMSTAEYAVGTVAAVGFAVVLYKVVRSPAVSSALSDIVKSAINSSNPSLCHMI